MAASGFSPATAGEAAIKGSVTVNNSRPLADAVVRVREAGTGKVFVTGADHKGQYQIKGLQEKKYLLEIEKDGRKLYMGIVDVKGHATVKDVNLFDKSAPPPPAVSTKRTQTKAPARANPVAAKTREHR